MLSLVITIGVLVFFAWFSIKKIIEFIFSSGGNEIYFEENQNNDEPLKVEIKNSKFNTSAIEEYYGENIKQMEFRPQKWEEFISQEEAKDRAKTIIKKVNMGIKSHLILSAIRGHGKTTFIELLAKTLNAKLIQRVGKQIDEDDLLNIMNEINTSEEKNVVLFIDEIDVMDWKIIKILNPIIEQFKINGVNIKPFTFACATINKHILIKNNPDTLDRIPHHINFIRYNSEDIGKIIKQYREHLYSEINVLDKIIQVISKNCKFNPRTSIALLEDYVVEKNIDKVLKNNNIIKDGLTNVDVKILEVLSETKRAIGANALSQRVGLDQNQYLREYEPFLVEFNYINRIPSRVISEKGKKLLETIKEDK